MLTAQDWRLKNWSSIRSPGGLCFRRYRLAISTRHEPRAYVLQIAGAFGRAARETLEFGGEPAAQCKGLGARDRHLGPDDLFEISRSIRDAGARLDRAHQCPRVITQETGDIGEFGYRAHEAREFGHFPGLGGGRYR